MKNKNNSGGWLRKALGRKKNDQGESTADQEKRHAPDQSKAPSIYKENCILVIDDSEIDRMILEELLGQAGYEVVLATDGEDGLTKFRDVLPIVTVTDMIMPGISGTEVILELLKEHPDAKFIAMSAGGELGPEVALAVAEAINIQTVAKPFDPEQILKAVKDLIPSGAKDITA